jgi:hypothetical protein
LQHFARFLKDRLVDYALCARELCGAATVKRDRTNRRNKNQAEVSASLPLFQERIVFASHRIKMLEKQEQES